MSDSPTRQKPGRRPIVATHPQRVEIELAHARGMGPDFIGRLYGVSRMAVHRHWHALPVEYRTRLAELAAEMEQHEARMRTVFARLAALPSAAPGYAHLATKPGELARAA